MALNDVKRPWPYFLFMTKAMASAIKRNQNNDSPVASPFNILANPKELRKVFSQSDIAKLFELNHQGYGFIPLDTYRPDSFFSYFWGEEMIEDLRPYLNNAVQTPILTDHGNIGKPHTLIEWLINPDLKPIISPIGESTVTSVIPESVFIVVLEEGEDRILKESTPVANAQAFDILTHALKAMYRMYPINVVSEHPWFRAYTEMLVLKHDVV